MKFTERLSEAAKAFRGTKHSMGTSMVMYGASSALGDLPSSVIDQELPTDATGFIADVRGNAFTNRAIISGEYFEKQYTNNSIIAACVNKKVSLISKAKFGAYTMTLDGESSIYMPNHYVSQLLASPWQGGTQNSFLSLIAFYMELGGYCVIRKVRDDKKAVIGFRPYNASQVGAVIESGNIIGWVLLNRMYGIDSFLAEDSILVNAAALNAKCPAFGISWISSVRWDADTMVNATRYMGDVLENGGIPTTAVIYERSIQEDAETISKRLEAAGIGQNKGKVVPLGDNAKVQRLGLSPADVNLLQIADSLETHICSASGVPPGIAGTRAGLASSTYNNREQDGIDLLNNIIIPTVQIIGHALQQGMQNESYDPFQIEADMAAYTLVETRNIDARRADITAYEKGLLSLEEVRIAMGYDPDLPDDATLYVAPTPSFTLSPTAPGASPEDKKQPPPASGDAAAHSAGDDAAEFTSYPMDDSASALQWHAVNTIVTPFEKQLATGIGEAFTEFGDQFIGKALGAEHSIDQHERDGKSVHGSGTAVSMNGVLVLHIDLEDIMKFWNSNTLAELLQVKTQGTLRKLLKKMWEQSLKEINVDPKTVSATEFDRFARESLKSSLNKIKDGVSTAEKEVRKRIQKVVSDNYDASPEAIIAKLRIELGSKFNELASGRAKAIATTSSTFAATSMQKMVWDKRGITFMWLSQRDAVVRLTHRVADSTLPDENGFFHVGSDVMEHPCAGGSAKENVNCRCYLAPDLNK